jgi:hypothetical protein
MSSAPAIDRAIVGVATSKLSTRLGLSLDSRRLGFGSSFDGRCLPVFEEFLTPRDLWSSDQEKPHDCDGDG